MSVNKRRLRLLSKEELQEYQKEEEKLSNLQQTMPMEAKKYLVVSCNGLKYVLMKNSRVNHEKSIFRPNFEGTGLCATGILLKGETLEDFLFHCQCMEKIIDWRCMKFQKMYFHEWHRQNNLKK